VPRWDRPSSVTTRPARTPSKSSARGGRTRAQAAGPAPPLGRVRPYTAGLSSSASCPAQAPSTANTAGPNRAAISNAVTANAIPVLTMSSIRETRPRWVTRQAKNAAARPPNAKAPGPTGPVSALKRPSGPTASESRKYPAISKPAHRGSRHTTLAGTSLQPGLAAPGLPTQAEVRKI
jgi:hypothetical protein